MYGRGMHAAGRAGRPAWWRRWWAIAGAAVLGLALVAGGVSALVAHRHQVAHQAAVKKAAQAAAARTAALSAERTHLLAAMTFSPSTGSGKVALNGAVHVSTPVGRFVSVTATGGGGPLSGALSANHQSWTSTGQLLPSTTYTVIAVVEGAGGVRVQRTSTFTTAAPVALVSATLWPSSGLSVGVGQPIVVYFSQPIITPSARTGVLSHLRVTMSHPVAGGWYWFSPTELHFRPEQYWPSGDQVTLAANLTGWNAGSGEWGTGQESTTFSIGDARISYANLATEQMTVTDNGKVIATYPLSGGRPQYPTMDGVHIVLDRESVVRMDSATVGIPVNSPNGYNEIVYDDVHISDSGEYVHAAPWSVGSQGVTNVSHGCINISPANALSFFNFSRVGDIVDVTGSPRPPAYGDHGVMDWSTPWSQWIPAVVHG